MMTTIIITVMSFLLMVRNKVQQTARRTTSSVYGDMSPRRQAIYFSNQKNTPAPAPEPMPVPAPVPEADSMMDKILESYQEMMKQQDPIHVISSRSKHQDLIQEFFSPKRSRETIRHLRTIEGTLGIASYMGYRRLKLKRKEQLQRVEALRLFMEENPDACVEPPPEVLTLPKRPTMTDAIGDMKKALREEGKELLKKFENMVNNAAEEIRNSVKGIPREYLPSKLLPLIDSHKVAIVGYIPV